MRNNWLSTFGLGHYFSRFVRFDIPTDPIVRKMILPLAEKIASRDLDGLNALLDRPLYKKISDKERKQFAFLNERDAWVWALKVAVANRSNDIVQLLLIRGIDYALPIVMKKTGLEKECGVSLDIKSRIDADKIFNEDAIKKGRKFLYHELQGNLEDMFSVLQLMMKIHYASVCYDNWYDYGSYQSAEKEIKEVIQRLLDGAKTKAFGKIISSKFRLKLLAKCRYRLAKILIKEDLSGGASGRIDRAESIFFNLEEARKSLLLLEKDSKNNGVKIEEWPLEHRIFMAKIYNKLGLYSSVGGKKLKFWRKSGEFFVLPAAIKNAVMHYEELKKKGSNDEKLDKMVPPYQLDAFVFSVLSSHVYYLSKSNHYSVNGRSLKESEAESYYDFKSLRKLKKEPWAKFKSSAEISPSDLWLRGKRISSLCVAGYFGCAFYQRTRKKGFRLVIAHCGTVFQTNPDIAADLSLALGRLHPQFCFAAYFTREVIKEFTYTNNLSRKAMRDLSVAHTGHSLGAAIAEVMVWRFRVNKHRSLTFESPGTSDIIKTLEENDREFQEGATSSSVGRIVKKVSSRMETYLAEPNAINTLHEHLGKMFLVRPLGFTERKETGLPSSLNWVQKTAGLLEPVFSGTNEASAIKLRAEMDPITNAFQFRASLFFGIVASLPILDSCVARSVSYFRGVVGLRGMLPSFTKALAHLMFPVLTGWLLGKLAARKLDLLKEQAISFMTSPSRHESARTFYQKIEEFVRIIQKRSAPIASIIQDNINVTHNLNRMIKNIKYAAWYYSSLADAFPIIKKSQHPVGVRQYIEYAFLKVETLDLEGGVNDKSMPFNPETLDIRRIPILKNMFVGNSHADRDIAIPMIRSRL